MKYRITLVVSGGNELKNDLEHGHVENGIATDVLPDEEILEFQYVELKEDTVGPDKDDDEPHCAYCGSGLFDTKGNCQKCGL
jgi:hypothetical protein